jgi:plastocyanin
VCTLAATVLAACGGGGSSRGGTAGCAPSGTRLRIAAQHFSFDKSCLAAPAGRSFTIAFDNRDSSIPHNVAIVTSGGSTVFTGQTTSGVRTVDYHVKGLPPGTYRFHCDLHPEQMSGTFVVR